MPADTKFKVGDYVVVISKGRQTQIDEVLSFGGYYVKPFIEGIKYFQEPELELDED
jgi:hypothetical protein